MRTVTGLFDSHDQARAAVEALEDAGIASGDISLISAGTDVEENTSTGIGIGSAVGGVGGLLAGLGAFAISGSDRWSAQDGLQRRSSEQRLAALPAVSSARSPYPVSTPARHMFMRKVSGAAARWSLREWTKRRPMRPLPFSANPVLSTSTKGDVHSKKLGGPVMTRLPVRGRERTRMGRSSRRSQDRVATSSGPRLPGAANTFTQGDCPFFAARRRPRPRRTLACRRNVLFVSA